MKENTKFASFLSPIQMFYWLYYSLLNWCTVIYLIMSLLVDIKHIPGLHIQELHVFLKWEFIFITYDLQNNRIDLRVINMGPTKQNDLHLFLFK